MLSETSTEIKFEEDKIDYLRKKDLLVEKQEILSILLIASEYTF